MYDISNRIKLTIPSYFQNKTLLIEDQKILEYNVGIPQLLSAGQV